MNDHDGALASRIIVAIFFIGGLTLTSFGPRPETYTEEFALEEAGYYTSGYQNTPQLEVFYRGKNNKSERYNINASQVAINDLESKVVQKRSKKDNQLHSLSVQLTKEDYINIVGKDSYNQTNQRERGE